MLSTRSTIIALFILPFITPLKLQAAETIYENTHDEISIEQGSPDWEKLPPAEQQRYLKETEDYFFPPGEPETCHDFLVLGPWAGKTQQFCLLHTGRLDHQCLLSGSAVRKGNVLEYHDPELKKCRLKITFNAERINVEDIGGECHGSYCGIRTSFEEASFANRSVSDPEVRRTALKACPLKGK